MPYRITGTYVTSCSCSLICPCSVDGPPTGPGGVCYGAWVLHIAEGSLDEADLADVNVGINYHLPSNTSSGNWRLRVVVDRGASDEQARAIERILRGQEGGPFGEFAPLIADVTVERGDVTFSDGDSPSASIGTETEIGFEPHRGPDGKPTIVRGAMFGFAPEYRIGRGSGRAEASGFSYEPVYGEAAEFEYAS